jgi:HlyD family secretion protein
MVKKKRVPFFIVLVLLASGGLYVFFTGAGKKVSLDYESSVLGRGSIAQTVSSSGKMQAVGTVNVLTQLTGTVERVLVDFNDTVKKGQPLVELGREMLIIALREAEAALSRARAQYNHGRQTYEKNRQLFRRGLLSQSDFSSSRTELEVLRAALVQAETQHERARLNIDEYAIILSPIDGIVLDRKVEKGETVVANSGSVTQLFILAENLNTMEIKAEVDELDISSITLGQEVRFSVEAYPGRDFTGEVRQVRKVPEVKDNVVNYTVIVATGNPEGLLLPGMTANMEFLIVEKKDILVVPNAAFRFNPPPEAALAARRRALEESLKDRSEEERKAALARFDENAKAQREAPRPAGGLFMGGGRGMRPPQRMSSGGGGGSASGGGGQGEGRRNLWFQGADGLLVPRTVKTGIANALYTEIVDSPELEGLAVIVREK